MSRRPVLTLAATALAALALAACGDDDGGGGETAASDRAPEHIHGLGVNPADGALYIASHSGLFRSDQGAASAEPVGDSAQDTMGFTVIGADRFLGSGHPAPGEDGPPHLGLIESTDAGESWSEVSLAGEADFHVLRFAHDRVYGYNGLTGELLISDDGGESWDSRTSPAPMIDLAIDPEDPERMIGSTEGGVGVSTDGGETWKPLVREIGLLAWPEARRLYLVNAAGEVRVSDDVGESWSDVGSIGGQPAALAADGPRTLYAALADGTVLESADGGASWDVRSEP
jgi:photosystem II stability/assembly factor-like uncharacterized protein